MLKGIAGVGALSAMAVGISAYAQDPPAPATDPAYLDYMAAENTATLPDGRRLQVVCMGEGSPTVILTAGLSRWGYDWRKVQKSVAEQTRVCSWDRPGWGFSDPSPVAQTTSATTDDLTAALRQQRIDGPYVMVGHSMGAYESMIFTDRHPDQVAGLVFVDGSIPNQTLLMNEGSPVTEAFFAQSFVTGVALLGNCAAAVRAGTPTADVPDPLGCFRVPPSSPVEVATAIGRLTSDPRRFETMISAIENFDASSAELERPSRDYGDLPLIVLTAGRTNPLPGAPPEVAENMPMMEAVWRRGHENVAALSTRGVNRIVPDAGHDIQLDRPDVVIAAVLEVIEAARSDQPPRSMPAP